jgi:hypothetical protein
MDDALAFDFRTTDELDTSLGKPDHKLADCLQGFGLMRLKDDSDPRDWRHWSGYLATKTHKMHKKLYVTFSALNRRFDRIDNFQTQ